MYKKNKVLNIFIVIISMSLVIVLTLLFIKYFNRYKNEENIKTAINHIIEKSDNDENKNSYIDEEYNGYKVYGLIKIEKINLEYLILDSLEEKALNISIIKFFNSTNKYGFSNLTLAGHNNYDNTMFGNLKKLENGDIIEITDKNLSKKIYHIYDIYITSPMDVEYTNYDNDNKYNEVTLVTCIYGNSKRYIIKAKEIL